METQINIAKPDMAIRSTFRKEIKENGYLKLSNIPEYLVEPILLSLGSLYKQDDSNYRHSVSYEEGYDHLNFSRSTNEIGAHTEFPHHNIPPEFQSLYCLEKAKCSGGATYVCDSSGFIESLSDEEFTLLKDTKIQFLANSTLDELSSLRNEKPLLEEVDGDFIIRFSHNLFFLGDVNGRKDNWTGELRIENEELKPIVNRMFDYFEKSKVKIVLEEKELLIWNNHKSVHWRDNFQDKNRRLTRYMFS
jgi:hypothetical protein